MKTRFRTKEEALEARKWVVVDAADQVVGRVATRVASLLRGKDNPAYVPHNDSGDFVIVINADKVRFSGQKFGQKVYYRHTGYVGGIKAETAAELLERKPEEVLKRAVKGMLPKNSLGRAQLRKLKVFTGAEHGHQAQQPVAVEL